VWAGATSIYMGSAPPLASLVHLVYLVCFVA